MILSRPESRNAVDGPTARALADAFRAFDADQHSCVAVLWGEGGTGVLVGVEGPERVGQRPRGRAVDGVRLSGRERITVVTGPS